MYDKIIIRRIHCDFEQIFLGELIIVSFMVTLVSLWTFGESQDCFIYILTHDKYVV